MANRLVRYLKEDIWKMDEQHLPRHKQWGVMMLRRIMIASEQFVENNIPSFAAALTYSCILAAVPVLSIVFAIARGFGFGDFIEERVRQNMQMGGDMTDTVFSFINHYLSHIHGGAFLGAGILLLVYTVVMLTSNIETAFNTIWHVRSPRNIYRQIVDYVSVFMLLPLLIVVTSGFSVFMVTLASDYANYIVISHTMQFAVRYAPVAISALVFILLYKFLPNTHVRWRSVILPGIIAAIAFQLLQYFYINYQVKISSYNAIYGSFAALPLLMLWLQFTWYICLFGAELCHANQRAEEYVFTKDVQQLSRHDHDGLCLLLMKHICQRFAQGERPFSVHSLSQTTLLPHSTVQGLLDELSAAQLIREIQDSENTGDQHYMPGRDLAHLTPNYIIQQLDKHGKGHLSQKWQQQVEDWKHINELRSNLQMPGGNRSIAED